MSYEYIVHRNLSKKQVIDRYEPFTFPSFLQKSKVRQLQEPFFVVEAMYEKERVGLAVLELLPKSSLLKVLSLYVKEDYRRRGVATQILKIAERVAINNQLAILNIIFQNNWESFKIMPKLLTNLAWNQPEKRMVLVKLSYQQIKDLDWFKIKDFPEKFSIKPWLSLTETEYNYIREKQSRQQWYPPTLSPFQMPEMIANEASFVLLHENEIVGWFIAHLVAEKTIQISSYFVDEKHRKTKASIAIISNAIQEVYEKGVAEYALFMFEASNTNMINLSKKLAGEHNTGAFTEVWVSHKKVL